MSNNPRSANREVPWQRRYTAGGRHGQGEGYPAELMSPLLLPMVGQGSVH